MSKANLSCTADSIVVTYSMKGPKCMKTTCIGQAEDDLAASGLIMYIMASAASDLALKPLPTA